MDLNMRTPRLIYFKAFVQGDTTAFKRESTSIQRATGATVRNGARNHKQRNQHRGRLTRLAHVLAKLKLKLSAAV